MAKLVLCLFILSTGIFPGEEGFIPVSKKEKITQGEIALKTASEYLGDRKYLSCIEKIKEFQILFHDHPSFSKSHRLLSNAYEKAQKWDKVAETEMNLYRENPETEEGLAAYLNAGKAYVRIGKSGEAKKIFESLMIKENTSKLAKEAELELKMMNSP
ncbi:MAG: hypothetical protein IT569_04370 [Leptospiraceae bacterium]|nr:hypothetical protein [Leptospiraceae bacterium]